MNTPTYSQSGNYIAFAGLVVSALSHFGIVISTNDIVQIIGGAVVLYGIITQYIAHKKLAVATGAVKS